MNESISVMTDAGELVATPFAGGISVDINLPDGKGSGQLAFIEAAPEGLRDDYPTPVHVFTYDGLDSEPVHRTDVHLDGDAMTLDPVKGAAGIELDTDFDIDPRDIKYTMMEPRGGKWESDRIDLYTPQDCFGFSEPFAGRIEYSEKKPKIAAKAKPDPADLGRRASVAAGATVRDGVDGGGIKL